MFRADCLCHITDGEVVRNYGSLDLQPHGEVRGGGAPVETAEAGVAGSFERKAIDIADLTNPSQAGFFKPTPLKVVGNEDPALSRGPATTVGQLNNPDVNDPDFQSKVVMSSYPIIKNGLIYVVDVRNGLYILKYTGPHAQEVQGIEFLEGNSNLGDAVDLDQNQQ